MSLFDLQDKNILITGASSGIGRGCAITASTLGANIILIGRNKERLQKTFDDLKPKNNLIIAEDITRYDRLDDIVNESVEKTGKISGFVHCAGIELTLPLRSMQPAHYEKLFSINVISGFELSRIISKKKNLSERGASFIFMSSVMGLLGQPGRIGYCSSKSALVSGCKTMALELVSKKIRVNCIMPGMVKTEMLKNMFDNLPEESKQAIINMHPMGLGEVEDIANLCAFLMSDAARWITGTELVIDGGYSSQ